MGTPGWDDCRFSILSLYFFQVFLTTVHYVNTINYNEYDRLFGIVVSTSDCHPRGPGFDSRLYPRNFSGSIGSGMGSTQPREDNWAAT